MFSGHNISFLDFGFEVSIADRVSNGQVPYRDFFTLINPLHFFLTSIFITIYQNIFGLFLYASIIGSLISVFIFLLAFRLKNIKTGILTWSLSTIFSQIFIGVAPNYSFTATLFYLIAFYLLIPSFVQRQFNNKILLLSGIFASLSFWTKQTIGAYFIIGLIAYLILTREWISYKKLLPFAYGYLSICFTFLTYLIINGALTEWFSNTVMMSVTFAGEAKINPPFLDLGINDGSSFSIIDVEKILFNVLLIFFIIELVWFFRAGKKNLSRLTVFLFSSSLFLIVNERFSMLKLIVAMQLLVVYIVVAWLDSKKTLKAFYGILIFILIFLGLFRIISLNNSYKELTLYRNNRGSIYLNSFDLARINFATEFMTKNSDKNIIVLPQYPIYYYFSGIKNPTRYDLVLPGNTPIGAPEEINQLLNCSIDYVVFDEAWKFDGVSFSDYNKLIYDKISISFVEYDHSQNGVIIYKNRYIGC